RRALAPAKLPAPAGSLTLDHPPARRIHRAEPVDGRPDLAQPLLRPISSRSRAARSAQRVEALHERAALVRVAHVHVGRPAAQLLERLAAPGLAELAVADRRAQLADQLARDS